MECDPSIKAIILKIDSAAHDYIVEDLDDQTLVIKESQLQRLKLRLEEVRTSIRKRAFPSLPLWVWGVGGRKNGRKGMGREGKKIGFTC